MFRRNIYLDQLIKLKGTSPIKVITGVRRCGKSTLLDLFEEHLVRTKIPKKSIIRINFEFDEFDYIRDYRDLTAYIKPKIPKGSGGKTFILLDEVQLVPGWEKAVNSLRAGKQVDLYITGSNANMLSSTLATLLSGRYMEIKMLPLSFKEYLAFNGYKKGADCQEYFTAYMGFGGFPGLQEMRADENLIRSFLSGIYNTILMKDVAIRTSIRNLDLLEKVVRFTASNIGNIISAKKISDYLTSTGRKTSHETIDIYLETLERAFFLYKAARYDIKGKELLKTQGKYYIVDMGLRYWSLGKQNIDMGSILENIVFLELIRRGYQVFVGKLPGALKLPADTEIDFVAIKDGLKTYYQVTVSMQDPKVRERELRALNAIDDQYDKIILTLDRSPFTDYGGITQRNIIDFLLE
ncbi:ATPase [Spirochaetia bacterium]|nr:ATPase [Spirochaetia bacterium]